MNRRRFLGLAGAAAAAPMIVPSRVLGLGNWPSPNSRITMGIVGWGMMGPGNTDNFLKEKDCQIVAACDLDKDALGKAVDKVNGHYKNKDCKAYHDYREMMARPDIDAVMLAVPDHWHALVATEACRQRKIFTAKNHWPAPSLNSSAIVNAVHRIHRIWQTGSWQRSTSNFHKAAEIVRSGFIGKVKRVEVGLPEGHDDFKHTKDKCQVSEPPARARLRHVGRPVANDALHRMPRAHELALELQYRRRPVAGLGRPPPRHRPLGPWTSTRSAQ